MKDGKGEPARVLIELSAEAWEAWRGQGALRPTAARQGLPVGALTTSCHSWSMRESPPPHLTFISFISDPLEAQRQGVIPFPHFYAGKVPLWASLDTATLGGWGRRVPPPGRKLHCADHKPTPGCWEQDAR